MSSNKDTQISFPISFTIEEKPTKRKKVEKGAEGFQESKPKNKKSRTNKAPFRRGESYQKNNEQKAQERAELLKMKKEIKELKQSQKEYNDKFKNVEGKLEKTNDVMDKFNAVMINPPAFMGKNMTAVLRGAGPYSALAVAAVASIAAAPETVAAMIQTLSKKGLPLNRDWRRLIEDEVNGLFSEEEQKNRAIGIDSYIITQMKRYMPLVGGGVYNSLENLDEIRLTKFGQDSKARGLE